MRIIRLSFGCSSFVQAIHSRHLYIKQSFGCTIFLHTYFIAKAAATMAAPYYSALIVTIHIKSGYDTNLVGWDTLPDSSISHRWRAFRKFREYLSIPKILKDVSRKTPIRH